MAALTVSPTNPVPKFQTTVRFALTQTGTDFIRVWCTVAPTGSELDSRINSNRDPRNRIVAFEGSPATAWNYTFDKGGKYTFVAQEYLKGSGYGGGYEGDPNTADKETLVGTETTLTVFIGQRVTQPIGPPGNQATLVLWVWDDAIRATTKAFHGEDTPAIQAATPSTVVKSAIETTSVKTALAALVDLSLAIATTAGGFLAWTADYFASFNAHVDDGDIHTNADTYNVIPNSFLVTPDQKSYIEFVNQALKALRQHVTNDLGTPGAVLVGTTPFGPDSGNFHMNGSGDILSDRANVPLYQSVSSYAEAYGALADLYRCFTVHQADAYVHDSVDVFPIATLSYIQRVHSAFLTVLASPAPVTPPAQSDGVQTLITVAGFTET